MMDGMERTGVASGVSHSNESFGKRVWYGIGKAVESQSPRAWNERIIKTINEKILPKLDPEQLAWVSKHHKAIETGATATGVVISSAEMATVFIVAEMGAMRLLHITRFNKTIDTALKDPWFKELRETYTKKVAGSPAEFAAVAGTMVMLFNNLSNEQKSTTGSPTRGNLLRHGSPASAKGVLEQVFVRNFKDMDVLSRRVHGSRLADPAELDAQAKQAYAAWEKTDYHGLEGILDFAGIKEPNARRVYRKVQGIDHRPTRPATVYTNIRPIEDGWVGEEKPLYQVTLDEIRRRNEKKSWKANRRGSKGQPFEKKIR